MNEMGIQKKHIVTVRVVGLPKGQPRPRAFVRASGRAGVYDSGTAEGWKGSVALAFQAWEGRCLQVPLQVMLVFFLPRPKVHYRSNGLLKPNAPRFLYAKKPDADNLAKAVMDALTEIRVWQDDDQICELGVMKRWEISGDEAAGCLVRISELSEVDA